MLEVHLRRGAATTMAGDRARRGAVPTCGSGCRGLAGRLVQHRRRLLVEVALVGRGAALATNRNCRRHHRWHRCRSAPAAGWCRCTSPRHRDRRDLGVAEVGLHAGLVERGRSPPRRRRRHHGALLALDDGSAGVLAHRQDTARPQCWRSSGARAPRTVVVGRGPPPSSRIESAAGVKWPGRSRWEMSLKAWAVSSVSASGLDSRARRPLNWPC